MRKRKIPDFTYLLPQLITRTEIKTIARPISDYAEDVKNFDRDVNEALNDGFILKKRRYIPAIPKGDGHYLYAKLYAELERKKIEEIKN